MTASLGENSRNPDGHDDLKLGKEHFRNGNFGLAEKHFRQAVEQSQDNIEAVIGLAASYDQLGRFELSDRLYGEAMRISGGSAAVLNNRGYSYYLRRDFKRAPARIFRPRVAQGPAERDGPAQHGAAGAVASASPSAGEGASPSAESLLLRDSGDCQELVGPRLPDVVPAPPGESGDRLLDGVSGAEIVASGSRCAPPAGSLMMPSITPNRSRSCAVIFMLVAASCALPESRHRMEAELRGRRPCRSNARA